MKKFFIFILLATLMSSAFAYMIPTSKGDVEVSVPDGMTLEQAFCEMSRLYLEEKWDHEELIEKSQSLSESIDSYIAEVNKLRAKNKEIVSDYEKIVNLYSTATKTKVFEPYIGFAIESDIESNLFGGGFTFGGVLFEKFMIQTDILYPWSLQLGLNILI